MTKESPMTIAPLPPIADRLFAPVDDQLALLRSQIAGELITPDHIEYETARRVQQNTVDRRPLAIVRAMHAGDVATSVNFAREYIYPLAVRSGGHSVGRHSMADDALVIDLSRMKRIEIDPVTRIARVQAGATSGDLAVVAQEHGLALTTGDTSSVGFGGLVTGGGIGFIVRKHGLTIDSLLAAEVVTARGEIVTASADEHPELFWAIRGGGGNFGIVTEFTFRLAPVGQILGGDLLLPATPEVVRGYLNYTPDAPEGLSTIANLMYAPPFPWVPEELVGTLVVSVIICWTGDAEEGERAIAPLRALATPLADTVRPMPYPDIYLSTAHQTAEHGFSLRSTFANELSDASIAAMFAAMEQPSSPFSIVHLRGLGGALGRIPSDATAFAHRDARYMFAAISIWFDPTEDPAPHRAWSSDLLEQVRHDATGVYVNFLENEGEERVRDAYPPETLARLARVKRTYDPLNLFRLNENIAPYR
jgi:FAD/FMN-containing dehydrogenase